MAIPFFSNLRRDIKQFGAGPLFVDTIKGLPQAASKVIGQPSMRAYADLAGAITGKPLISSTTFQKELYGTDKSINFRSVGEEVLPKGSKSAPILGTSAITMAPLFIGSKETYKKEEEIQNKTSNFNREDFRNKIVYTENRGAVAISSDLYKVKGVTGDLGKYQANPQTVKDWSKVWLGKQYSPQEFLNDANAQEQFFDEFINVIERYNLTQKEAAIAWHRGWGELGIGPKKTREQRFRDKLSKMIKESTSQKYLTIFNSYGKD